jgi:hypothetical protein
MESSELSESVTINGMFGDILSVDVNGYAIVRTSATCWNGMRCLPLWVGCKSTVLLTYVLLLVEKRLR